MTQTIGIIGLGYVGLQLAVAFGKQYKTIGFDKSLNKVKQLKRFIDDTNELTPSDLKRAKLLNYTSDFNNLKKCNYIIVAVPTPINRKKVPDLELLKSACVSIGKNINKNTLIIFESTVYPGVTEDICVPIIEQNSALKWMQDFNIGYSPERINPGDKTKTISNINKVVSGDNKKTLNKVAKLYSSIINKKIHKASSIKVAEMAKVLENTQRDLNIALINEIAILCDKLNIDSKDVIDSAKTKWNFMPFRPGLVGGHCIGVDPYYLTFKAKKIGYNPKVILSGRELNDSIPDYVSKKIIIFSKNCPKNLKVNILGMTFKENCSDIRNSKIYNVYKKLTTKGFDVKVHDPIANYNDVKEIYNINLVNWNELHDDASVMVFAVAHSYYKDFSLKTICSKLSSSGTFFDVKSFFDKKKFENMKINYKRF